MGRPIAASESAMVGSLADTVAGRGKMQRDSMIFAPVRVTVQALATVTETEMLDRVSPARAQSGSTAVSKRADKTRHGTGTDMR